MTKRIVLAALLSTVALSAWAADKPQYVHVPHALPALIVGNAAGCPAGQMIVRRLKTANSQYTVCAAALDAASLEADDQSFHINLPDAAGRNPEDE